MGFFDKVKSMVNTVTGGSAKVSVAAPEASLTKPFRVDVTARSTGGKVKYEKVYVYLRGVERVSIPDAEVSVPDANGASRTGKQTVSASGHTLELTFQAAGPGEIDAGAEAAWSVEVTLPATAVPEFRGKFTEHFYEVYAGLDCFGNDPDSGWVRIKLS